MVVCELKCRIKNISDDWSRLTISIGEDMNLLI